MDEFGASEPGPAHRVPGVQGIRPHTRSERLAVIEKLIPLWQEKFGDNLLSVAVSASVARGEDCAYSDLELDLFLRDSPEVEDERYLQRVVDGMLIEVVYHTPEAFLRERTGIAGHWHMSASDRLVGVYNAPFIDELMAQIDAAHHTEDEFLRAASRPRYELQESFSKVLNAVEQGNVEGISLLVMDAVMHLLQVLALVNRHSFTTFGRYIAEARAFAIKPDCFDDLLDILVEARYRDLPYVGEVMWAVFAGVECIFEARGFRLYEDELDPNLLNRRYL